MNTHTHTHRLINKLFLIDGLAWGQEPHSLREEATRHGFVDIKMYIFLCTLEAV